MTSWPFRIYLHVHTLAEDARRATHNCHRRLGVITLTPQTRKPNITVSVRPATATQLGFQSACDFKPHALRHPVHQIQGPPDEGPWETDVSHQKEALEI